MKKIAVLGGGLVGRAMALDLAAGKEFGVVVADIRDEVLNSFEPSSGVETVRLDVTDDHALSALLGKVDFALNAVPGSIGYRTLQKIISSGTSAIDIAFFPEDLFDLDEPARANGVTVVSDIGVAPGMSHVLATDAAKSMKEVNEVTIYVGGLPRTREWPWEYKAVFSPSDVIEEYTRPARVVRNGAEMVVPPLSERERIFFKGIGTLEAFISDGLRSLTRTLKANRMTEKTLRYPGHAELMQILDSGGFFGTQPIETSAGKVVPLEVTSRLLFPAWQLGPDDEDITLMRIIVSGISDSGKVTVTWELTDYKDARSGIHSMARTTGYTATMAMRLLASGKLNYPGVHPPEFLASDPEWVSFLLNGLADRNVVYQKTIQRN